MQHVGGAKNMLSMLFRGGKDPMMDRSGGSVGSPGANAAAESQNALERFLMHMTSATAAAAAEGTVDRASLGSGWPSPTRRSRGNSGQWELVSSGESITAGGIADGLVPTFKQVPFYAILAHADASVATVDKLLSYVEERGRMEGKYARERSRLRLELRLPMVGEEGLESCLQALALFQDVEATQINALVEEIDKEVRQPLVRLRDELARVVSECRSEMKTYEKELEAQERKLGKHKKAMAALKEKRDRLVHFRRVQSELDRLPPEQQGMSLLNAATNSASTLVSYGIDIDRVSPPGHAHSGSSGFVAALFESDQRAEHPEQNVIPELERRIQELEGEMRASAAGVEGAAKQVLEALRRQDQAVRRWTEVLQNADEDRRKSLQRIALPYMHAQARMAQQALLHAEKLTRMLEAVDADVDVQKFIANHSMPGGSVMRYPALELLPMRPVDDSSTHMPQPLLNPNYSPPQVWRDTSASSGSAGSSRHSIPTTSPGRGGSVSFSSDDGAGSSASEPSMASSQPQGSFDEKEDTETLTALVHQLFNGGMESPATPQQPPPPPPLEPGHPLEPNGEREQRASSFNWDGLSAAVAAGAATEHLYSTPEERKRFWSRIFSGRDPKGRTAFLQELNQQRSKKTDVGEGFEELADIIWSLLLHSQRRGDTHNAKMAMMLSQTFWRHKPGGSVDEGSAGSGEDRARREFLSKRLIGHPLWSDPSFWEQALWMCVLEQLPTVELPSKQLWHDLSPEARDELCNRVHNIVFSQVGALAHSMVEFTGNGPEAADFVRRVAEKHGLSEEQRFMLLRHLSKHEGLGGP